MKKINLFSSKTINKVLYVPTLQTAMHILQRLLRRISSLFRHLLFWDCLYRCLAKLFASSSESMPLFHSIIVMKTQTKGAEEMKELPINLTD